MSENQSFPASSDVSEQLLSSQTDKWETAPIPGTVDSAGPVGDPQGSADTGLAANRETELLSLIHDLNQCNDVLLARVTQLESALENSQASHQSMQETSTRNAQQQVARLVGELDNAEQALSRQILVNENLQTEISNQQERISQLERECTVVAQQHLEEVQARAKAESTSKDLRSRLQRQQRYTMQFKAALEKSLTVTAKPSNTTAVQPVSFKDSAAVTMPKAQRIMPWVSDNSSPFAGIDPHLESLIRGVGKSNARVSALQAVSEEMAATAKNATTEVSQTEDETAESAAERGDRPDAKDQLWQDIERVMSHAEGEDSTTDKQPDADDNAEEAVSKQVKAEPTEMGAIDAEIVRSQNDLDTQSLDAQSSDPQLKEQPPVPVSDGSLTDSKPEDEKSASKSNSLDKDDLIHQIERSFAATSRQPSEEPVAFTEPSPWGVSPSEKQSDRKLERIAAGIEGRQASNSKDSYLPMVDSQINSAVSPLVKPLRVSTRKAAPAQSRSSSLSDIELPTFQNAKVASFRR